MEIIKSDRGPLVHIHYIERTVQGSGIGIKVYGQMKLAAKERVYAKELKLNTLEVLLLTPMTGDRHLFHTQKFIHNKGEYGNYASIDVFSADAYELMSSGRSTLINAATVLPEADGSIWLDFVALGE